MNRYLEKIQMLEEQGLLGAAENPTASQPPTHNEINESNEINGGTQDSGQLRTGSEGPPVRQRPLKSSRLRRYPDSSAPDLAEALEIAERLDQYGILLMWCGVLNDRIAVYSTEADRAKVPSAFVAYSEKELLSLWFGGPPSLSLLLQAHEAKKMGGGKVIASTREGTAGE